MLNRANGMHTASDCRIRISTKQASIREPRFSGALRTMLWRGTTTTVMLESSPRVWLSCKRLELYCPILSIWQMPHPREVLYTFGLLEDEALVIEDVCKL